MKKAIVFILLSLALNLNAKEITCSCKSANLTSEWTAVPAENFADVIQFVLACPVKDPLRDKIISLFVAQNEAFLDSDKGCKCAEIDIRLFFMTNNFKAAVDEYVAICKGKNA